MQEYLNENTLFATVAMFLIESDTLVLVVEGDDDHLALKDHSSPDLVLMPGTGGKPQVLKTAELARKRDLHGVRFLVDKDYDYHGEEPIEDLENVFVSETHDCFVDIVAGDARLLSKLIDVHTASARRRPIDGSRVPPSEQIRDEAMSLASSLAAVRVVDGRMRLCLDFKRFSFGELKVSEFNPRAICGKVLSRSRHIGHDVNEILDEVERARDEFGRFRQPPFGDHDLFAALARVLKCYKVRVSDRELQRGFILTITCHSLAQTGWFREIQDWCATLDKTGFTCGSELKLVA